MRMNNILILTSVDFRDFFDFNDFWNQKEEFISHPEELCIIDNSDDKQLTLAFSIFREWLSDKSFEENYSCKKREDSCWVIQGKESTLELGNFDKGLLYNINKHYSHSPAQQIGILVLMYLIDELNGANWSFILKQILTKIPGKIDISKPVSSSPKGKPLDSFFDMNKNDIDQIRNGEKENFPTVIELDNSTSEFERVYIFRKEPFIVKPFDSRWALHSNKIYIDILPPGERPPKDLLQTRLQNVSHVNITVGKDEEVIWVIKLPALREELCVTNTGRMMSITESEVKVIAHGATEIAITIEKLKIKNNEHR